MEVTPTPEEMHTYKCEICPFEIRRPALIAGRVNMQHTDDTRVRLCNGRLTLVPAPQRYVEPPKKMTKKEAVTKLDLMNGDRPEVDHEEADEILLEMVPKSVKKAYLRLTDRARYWATS